MGWKDLSAEQRAEVYYRFNVEKESIVDLSQEYDIYVSTLERALRRYRQQMRGGEPTQPAKSKEAVEVRDNGNGRELESNSSRITNLEELVAECNIDLNEWAVERHVVNKWEVGVKDEFGNVRVEPLFQVKAWLVRKEPVAVKPVIKPVYINVSPSRPAERKRGMRAALILPDPQFGFAKHQYKNTLTPFHDRRALSVVEQIAEDIEPDTTIYLGDLVDNSAWSDKYTRQPEFYFTTQPALIEGSWSIARMRNRTSGDVFVLEGNHDIRIQNMITNHLLEAYQLRAGDLIQAPHLLSIDNLLGLSRMGVEYVGDYPNGEVWINRNTRCIHGDKVKAGGGMTAGALVKEIYENTIYGHIHRIELAMRSFRTQRGLQSVAAFSPGCLCHVDGRVPGSKADNNWQQGAAIVWYDDEDASITPIEISNGRAVYNGMLYEGVDYKQELVRDTEWEF